MSLFHATAYIGIIPAAPGHPLTYAALDAQGDLLALGQGDSHEVLAFAGGQRAAFVALGGPRGPAQGLFQDPQVRQALSPPPRPGRWTRGRVAEYLLRRHNLRIHLTPTDEAQCPAWMRTGFRLNAALQSLGYTVYPDDQAPRQLLETYPHAVFAVLLGRLPFPKGTLEGRIQRQLVLRNQGLALPDPMRVFEEITRHRLLQGVLPTPGLYTPHELDALAAAWTAYRAHQAPAEVTRLGHPVEGEIVLPVATLLPRYRR